MRPNFEHCMKLVREGDRDRYLATLFAPDVHHDALFSLYAFNVEISRVRDLAREPMPGEVRLQWWREALSGERAGETAAHPVAAALREALERYGLSAERLIALIDARAFDLYDEAMATLTDLEIYGIKTQSALFGMAAEILGSRGVQSEMLTLDAGIAYSITGILSNFARHASRRQLYLPQDVLNHHGIDANRIYAREDSEPLRAGLADLRALARRHLGSAREKLSATPPQILPALLPAALAGPTLREMESASYRPFQFEPPVAWRRQWWLWRAARNPSRIFQS